MSRWKSGSSVCALVLVLGCSASTQTPAASGSPAAHAAFDAARAWKHVEDQVTIGPRVAGTAANARTRQYIINTLAGFGIQAREQPFEADTPLGPVKMANVIATLSGERPDRIILASHFDTKLFEDARFVGANDGASSTAALLELGRVLKDRPRPFTIELLFLDGEEAFIEWSGTDHTYGSRYYVQHARRTGTLKNIQSLVLLDMIADADLNIRRDTNSTRWLTDVIWSTARRLGHERYFVAEETAIEDDHIEFLQAGVEAVDIIDLDYHAWHTPDDTLENISARSLQIVGEVVLAALPEIEQRLLSRSPPVVK